MPGQLIRGTRGRKQWLLEGLGHGRIDPGKVRHFYNFKVMENNLLS
jgi:hypothetical protein